MKSLMMHCKNIKNIYDKHTMFAGIKHKSIHMLNFML